AKSQKRAPADIETASRSSHFAELSVGAPNRQPESGELDVPGRSGEPVEPRRAGGWSDGTAEDERCTQAPCGAAPASKSCPAAGLEPGEGRKKRRAPSRPPHADY